ncbi:MAG: type VI secretion system tip protein VgrG [Bacteroidota bacterium]
MSTQEHDLVSVKILVNSSQIKEVYDVNEVRITKEANRISTAKIRILDGSSSSEDFPISDGSEFVPGAEIEIQAGFGLTTDSVFKGIITGQSLQYNTHSGSVLTVECKDKAIKMTIGQNNGVFTDSTDSDVMEKLASNHGLSAKITSTSNTYPQIVQYFSTDWDFLLSRAEANGMIVIASDNELTVDTPKSDGSTVSDLTYGLNIFAFDTKMDARTQLGAVQATAWDYSQQALVNASADDPSVPDQGNISGSTLSSVASPSTFELFSTVHLEQSDLQSWANARLLKSRLAKIQGTLKVNGGSDYQPNVLVKLSGLGKRFNGTAYVSGVTHDIRNGNWYSHLNIGLSDKWFAREVDISARPASSLLPGIRGLQNGTVKQIYEDPKGETRIQVEVPIFKNSGESLVWARWVQPYATSNAGFFFMPEVEDEVVLGFLNDDPRFPVILGSLYSSQKTPPETPEEKNFKKAIVTNGQLKITFDDEKKIMTLETPGGNSITMNDEEASIAIKDSNGNEIEMKEQGISLNSPSSIKLTAEEEVTISGAAGVTISSEATVSVSADASLSLSGPEISIEAEAELSVSGGAAASITAEGEMSLTAAMIMIN